MKFFIIPIYLIAISIFATSQKQERLDILRSKGMDAFEKNLCLTDEGAIRYLEDYINLGGERDKVLKYLAYCKITVGQTKKNEIGTLKEGVKFLSEVFEKDNKNLDILKLLLSLYIQLGDFENAKTYAILINEENNIDNNIYILIARLYFNTQEYHKCTNYALKYKPENNDSDLRYERLFIIAYSYFKLNDYKNSKIYFNKLLSEKELSKDFKNISLTTLKIIDQNENFGKYSSWYNISLTNGLVFDSNIISQPPFSTDYSSSNSSRNLPGLPIQDDLNEEISAMGARDENYISLFLYPLNLNEHSIIFNLNNFIALHYPKKINEVFDPQEYDTINLSGFIGYEYHNYFTKKNVLKLSIFGGYDINWINPVKNIGFYSKAIKGNFNIYYRFKNNIELSVYSSLSLETYNEDESDLDIHSQNGKYFDSILSTSLPITNNFIIYLSSGYIGSRTTSDLFYYNGFLGMGKLAFRFFNFLELSLDIRYEQKGYKDEERKDQLISVGSNINFNIKDYFSIDLSYSYDKNNSTVDKFYYTKHLFGLYFNFIM